MSGRDEVAEVRPSVHPLGYELDLRFDGADTYSGILRLRLRAVRRTPVVRLDAHGLTIQDAWMESAGQRTSLQVEAGVDHLCLRPEEALGRGEHFLQLRWRGALAEVPEGMYRTMLGGEPAVVTQLQPVGARRVFPCFDDPRFRAPLRLTLTAPSRHMAAANMPIESVTVARGLARTVFAQTPPLPCSLYAWVIGRLRRERLTIASDLPLAMLAEESTTGMDLDVLHEAHTILHGLQRLLGIPFPFAKLDLLSLATLSSDATEYPGLITFRSSTLDIGDEDRETLGAARRRILAHELAHQWFGGLVSPRRWTDLWLSEGAATFLESRILDVLWPGSGASDEAFLRRCSALADDERPGQRAICEPLPPSAGTHAYYDPVVYSKAAESFGMIEAEIGNAAFWRLLGRVLRGAAWKSLDTRQFLRAVEACGGRGLADRLRRHLEQRGSPSASFVAGRGGLLRLRSRRRDSRLSFAVRVGDGSAGGVQALFDGDFIAPGPRDPAPIVRPNPGEAGYWTWYLPSPYLLRLCESDADAQSQREWAALPGTLLRHLVRGLISASDLYVAIGAIGRVARPMVVAELVELHRTLAEAADGSPAMPSVAASVRRVLLPALGSSRPEVQSPPWVARENERLLDVVARWGEDEATTRRLAPMAREWLAGARDLPKGLARIALASTAANGDEGFQDQVFQALREARSPARRAPLLVAVGAFPPPSLLERGFEQFLDPAVGPDELSMLLSRTRCRRDAGLTLARWLVRQWKAVHSKAGLEAMTWLPWFLDGLSPGEVMATVGQCLAGMRCPVPGLWREARRVEAAIAQRAALRARLLGDSPASADLKPA